MDTDLYTKIFENDDFIIIDKHVEADFHTSDGILSHLRQEIECYGVHRLDKPTTGLLVFAKSKKVQSELSVLFANRSVNKTYYAISLSRPKKKQGLIKGDMLKGRGGNFYLAKTSNNPSLTKFLSAYNEIDNSRVFALRPLTGKTHQLRVVLKSIGSPILGDERYAGQVSDRMYLHAAKLEFKLGKNEYSFESLPKKGEFYTREAEILFLNLCNDLTC